MAETPISDAMWLGQNIGAIRAVFSGGPSGNASTLEGQPGSYYLAAENLTGTVALARLPAITFASLSAKPTTVAGYGITDAQPLDSDLTAIAALATQAFGRSLLTTADDASVRAAVNAAKSGANTDITSITGSAAKLTTARAINDQAFDGTAAITVTANWPASRTLSFTGDATGSLSTDGSANTSAGLTLATVNANVGTFGSSTAVPVLTVDGKGRITAVATATITGGGGGTGTVTSVSGTAPIVSNGNTTTPTISLADNGVTNAKLAQIATASFKGRTTAGTGNVEDLSATQATALLNVASTSAKGLVPQLPGGTTTFYRGDGSFAAPPSGGGGSFRVDSYNIFYRNGSRKTEIFFTPVAMTVRIKVYSGADVPVYVAASTQADPANYSVGGVTITRQSNYVSYTLAANTGILIDPDDTTATDRVVVVEQTA